MREPENGNGNSPGVPDLETEAGRLRSERSRSRRSRFLDSGTVEPVRGSLVRRVLYALLPIACVAGAVLLLSLPALRMGVVERIAGIFVTDPDNTLYDLPAPPPRAANITEQFQASSAVLEDDEILYAETRQPEKIEPFTEETEPVKLARTPGSLEAFAFMKEDEGKAGALLRGEASGLEFRDWNLVSQTPPVYLLDIVAVREGQESELHLIFSVDISKKEIAPLSQAARDFMRQ